MDQDIGRSGILEGLNVNKRLFCCKQSVMLPVNFLVVLFCLTSGLLSTRSKVIKYKFVKKNQTKS